MKNQLVGNSRENNITLLGAQGPTVFFHNLNFTSTRKWVDDPSFQFYSLLTTTSIPKVFVAMFNFVRRQRDDYVKTVLTAYIRGYLNAYTLARNLQPYIYYFGGFDNSNEFGSVFTLNRLYLQTRVDILYEQAINERTAIKNIVHVAPEELMLISDMFYNVAIDVYSLGDISKKTFSDAYYKMRKKLGSFALGSTSSKKMLSDDFEPTIFTALARAKRVENTDAYDFLNLREKTWKHPVSGFEINFNFMTLVEEAKEEIPFINTILKKFAQNIYVEKEITDFCMGINYKGVPLKQAPTYCNVIFEEKPNGSFIY